MWRVNEGEPFGWTGLCLKRGRADTQLHTEGNSPPTAYTATGNEQTPQGRNRRGTAVDAKTGLHGPYHEEATNHQEQATQAEGSKTKPPGEHERTRSLTTLRDGGPKLTLNHTSERGQWF
ncbi:Protein of unknown function [Gryllus bimaculatus]|nr:Protein of unknown function [Gryllus bimaculatus]